MEKILVHRRSSPEQVRRFHISMRVLLIFYISTPLLMLTWLGARLNVDWDRLAGLIKTKLFEDPSQLLLLLGYPAFIGAYMYLAPRHRKSARLILSDEGMTYQSGLPGFLRRSALGGDWHLRWDEITRIRHFKLQRGLRVEVKNRLPIMLRPLDWVKQISDADLSAPLSDPDPVRSSVLWRELQAHGLFAQRAATFDTTLAFEVDQHPATLWAIAAGAACVLYGLIDAVADPEGYLHPDGSYGYLLPSLLIGVLLGAVAAASLRTVRTPARVPVGVALGMGLLLTIGGCVAGYSAMLRINQLYGGSLQPEPYRRQADCITLAPHNAELPRIQFSVSTRSYWCGLALDQEIPVPVRKGLLGTYQADLSGFVGKITTTAPAKGAEKGAAAH